MGTELNDSDINSASTMTEGKPEKVREQKIDRSPVTTSSSETDIYTQEIVLRGLISHPMIIAIDVNRERLTYKNLLANHGPVETETIAGHEG